LAARDGERKVDRRGRPLKSKANGSRTTTTTTTTTTKRDPNTTRPSGRAATAASAAPEIRSTKNGTTTRKPKLGPEERAKKEAIYGAPQKDYSKKKADGGVNFGEAFNYYRNEKKQKTFTWDGKKYNTKLLEEAEADKKKASTAKASTAKAANGKTSTKETSATKKSAGKKGLDRFRSRKRAGGGMMKKKGFSQGGSATEEPSEESIGAKRHAKRVEAKMAEIERIRKNNKKKVPSKKRPIDKSLKAKERRKRSMNRGGMMTKKGYAKGGMTKKGYAKGGSVRGKPRGVGAALRGYGKALK